VICARIAVGSDHGSGTVWVLTLLLVVVTVAAVLTAAVGAAGLQTRAGSAADLAALAAAGLLQRGESGATACAAAQRIARLNAATVQSCTIASDVVTVVVATMATGVGGVRGRASARSGPVG